MEAEPISRKSVSLTNSLWERVLTVQYSKRLISQSEALRLIITAGLEAVEHNDSKTAKP